MDERNKLIKEYIDNISKYFDDVGYHINEETKIRIINKYINSNIFLKKQKRKLIN